MGKSKFSFFLDDQSNFMVSSSGGLFRLKGNEWISMQSEILEPLSTKHVRAIAQDENGNYWIGYGNNSPQVYTGDTLYSFEATDTNGDLLTKGSSNDIIRVNNRMAIASDYGIFILNRKFEIEKRYSFADQFPNVKHSFKTTDLCRRIVKDPTQENGYWVGGTMGLAYLNLVTGNWHHKPMPPYLLLEALSPEFSYKDYQNLMVTDVLPLNHKIYCATWGNGLMVFDNDLNTWQKYTYQAYTDIVPLDENIGARLCQINDSLIVMTTQAYKSPVIFNIYTEEFISFESVFNVLPASDYSDGIKLVGEELWIGYMNSVEVYKLPNIRSNRYCQLNKTDIAYMSSGDHIIWSSNFNPDVLASSTITLTDPRLTIELQKPVGCFSQYEWATDDTHHIIGRGFEHTFTEFPKGTHIFYYRLEGEENWKQISFYRLYKWYDHYWVWALILGLLTSIMYALYSASLRKRQQVKSSELHMQNTILELERKALQAQINPHFIFNSLVSVKSMIVHDDKKKATDFINNFASFIRKVLNYSQQDEITLKEELALIKEYIEIENTRFKFDLKCIVLIDDTINTNHIMIPPMVLQPFVENAIWHGILPAKRDGTIVIKILEAHNLYSIHIIDDGQGLDLSANPSKMHKSLGIDITIRRLQAYYGKEARVTISNREDSTGVIVIIQFQKNSQHL